MAINKEYDDVQLDVKFTQASTRANLVSEENISVSFGKLAKWYAALVPSGGSSGQFLGWNSDGTAKWVSNPNSDTKVTDTVGTANTYYPAGLTGTTTATGTQVFDTSFKFIGTTGTTSAVGKAQLVLGNSTASGTANNKQGSLVVYGSTAYAHTIQGAPTAARTLTLPDKTGTFALTSDIPSVPTVNDAVLTLKGAGTTVTTFSANAASPKSLDIVAGSNVTVTADATNSKISIASSHPTITKSTDTTSTASPAHGGTFTTVDSVTRDANGHVTKINTKTVTLPSDQNTDTLMTQTNTTTSADYRVLLSGNANDTTETTTGRKSTNLKFNPSSGGLYSFGFLWTDITGSTLDINTLTLSNGTLHSRRFIEKTDGGAANITNIPVTGKPFLLEVDLIRWGSTTDYITRQRFTNAANGTYSYVRYCTNGTWGNWTTRKYTDTDTKVTSSANHYTPATASGQDKTASASGATAAWSIDVVKGVTLNTDGKGHVTGISVTSGKIPANPNTDTKVTSADNHYAPATVSGRDKSASASGATAAWSIDVVKGVTLNTDGKGHVTGLSVTSGKIPGNPNTDRYVNSAAFTDDSANKAASPVKMTLTRAGSDSATIVGNIPKVSSSSAGVAPKGAAVSTQSQSTKFLREDGSWAAPSYTSNTNTTYTLGTSGNNVTLTPSSGNVQSITVPYASNAASANKLNTNAGSTNRPVYFSGGVPVQCDTPASDSWFKGVPLIATDGVMEIGKYIDFHNTNGSTVDYDYRMEITTATMTLHATGSSNTLTIKSPSNAQLSFQTTSSGKAYTAPGITCYPLTTSGMTSLFNFGGNLVIGGGESAKTLYDNNYDTIKTAENEDLYLCADNDIHIVTGCQTYDDKSIIEIDAVGKVYLPSTGGIIVKQRSDSNYASAVTWWKGGTAPGSGEYAPQIGQHNTGGDSSYPGSICILPYKSTTNPWGGNVGLFIRKDHVYIDGVELSKSTHTHKYAGSSSPGGPANSANVLNKNTRMDYGWDGVNYFNINGTAGNAAKVNDTPTTAWWHIMRFNNYNSSGYYTDLAIPFNATSLYYKRITSGSVQNGGWVKVLDSLNYTSYTYNATASRAANTVLAAPDGSAGTATFRKLVAADLPDSYLPLSGGTMTGAIAYNNATTRLNSLKNLTNDNVGTSATYFLTITNSWGKGGYTSVADAKTVLGLGSAAYTASTAYLASTTKYAASSSVGGPALSATRADYVNVVAGNEIRFYNDNQFTANKHFWLGYSWAAGSHYTPSGGSDTSSTTAPNITKFIMGNCSQGGLASVHAKTFILGNGSSPTHSSKTTTIATAATTTDRTITLPDASGNVILGTKGSTSYWGLMDGDASTANWIRATSNGFIPSAEARFFQTATSSLGTSTWYFNHSYIQNMSANHLVLGAAKTADGAAKGQLKFFSGNSSDATGTVTLECVNDAARTGDYTVKLPTWNGTIPVFEKLFDGALSTVSLSYSDINEYDLFLITVANNNGTSEQVTVASLWISNVVGVHDMPLIWGGTPSSSGGACNVTSGWIQLSKNSGTTTFSVAHKTNVAQMTSSGWSISSPTYNLYIRKIFGLKAYKRT